MRESLYDLYSGPEHWKLRRGLRVALLLAFNAGVLFGLVLGLMVAQ